MVVQLLDMQVQPTALNFSRAILATYINILKKLKLVTLLLKRHKCV